MAHIGNGNPGTPDMWEEFKRLICKLYEMYGGNCDDLDWGDQGETAQATLEAEYEANGLPAFTSPTQEQQFRDDLDELEVVCQSSDVPPAAATKAVTLVMIADMQSDLNGPS